MNYVRMICANDHGLFALSDDGLIWERSRTGEWSLVDGPQPPAEKEPEPLDPPSEKEPEPLDPPSEKEPEPLDPPSESGKTE